MITKPTLFILGAGASIPYGFPSGWELRQSICNLADNPNVPLVRGLVKHLNINLDELYAFTRDFRDSRIASIDAFLSRRDDCWDIGKLIIASLLVPLEREEQFNLSVEDDWYFALWNALVSNVSNITELKNNQIRIFTFNYDRSLESYLHNAILNTFRVSPEEAWDALKSFNISHVYGSLGEYGNSDDLSNGIRAYSPLFSKDSIAVAAKHIKVIPEARSDDAIFAKAKDAFRWAYNVCFLGFGFDPLNVQRLGFREIISSGYYNSLPRKVVASTLNKTTAEVDIIHEATLGVKDFHDKEGLLCVDWDNYNSTNLATLRRFAWLMQ